MANTYRIYYMRPEWFREGICGASPDPKMLFKTHLPVAVIQANTVDQTFSMMQGEVWSPNGEACDLIQTLGLEHTSMSVGDIVVDQTDNAWLCANRGFKSIGSVR